jgi:hypothetical protein
MGRRKTPRAEGLGEAYVCVGDVVENWAGEDCIVRKLYTSPQGVRRLKADGFDGLYDGPIAQFGWKGTPTCEDCAEQRMTINCFCGDTLEISDEERARLDAIIDEAEQAAETRGAIWPV